MIPKILGFRDPILCSISAILGLGQLVKSFKALSSTHIRNVLSGLSTTKTSL